jgi:hypothetical protein
MLSAVMQVGTLRRAAGRDRAAVYSRTSGDQAGRRGMWGGAPSKGKDRCLRGAPPGQPISNIITCLSEAGSIELCRDAAPTAMRNASRE